MYNHLILVSKEHMIVSDVANLIYTEIRVRESKQDNTYIQNEDGYQHLVERELNDKQIANFKANIHMYTKVKENKYGTVYQFGRDFKKMYWSRFPKVEEMPEGEFVDKKHPERTHKVCSKCKLSLPFSEFYVRSNKQLFSECKKCKKKRYNNKKESVSLQKTI